jgi:hypothetical protein
MNIKRESHMLAIVAAFFCLVTVVFFHPYFLKALVPFPANLLVSSFSPWKYMPVPEYPQGPPNKPIGFDNLRQAYPNRVFAALSLMKKSIPLWNPHILAGTPFLASYDTAVYYPLNLLYQVLPHIDAWSIMVMLQPIIAGIGMYLFLRSLDRPISASLFGSTVYAFSGWMIVYWEEYIVLGHSIIWLPLALYASTVLWRKKSSPITAGILLSALCLSILAGYLQMTIYVFVTVILWNAYLCISVPIKDKAVKIKKTVYLFGLIFIPVLLTSTQWLPALELYAHSLRGNTTSLFLFRDYLARWYHVVTLVAPDFWGNPGTYNYFGGTGFYFEKTIYMGILPIFFVSYVFFYNKYKEAQFWMLFSVVTFLMGFALPTSWLIYLLKIPILATSMPVRIFSLSILGMSVLASYGFHIFSERRSYKPILLFGLAVGACITVLWLFVCSAWYVTHHLLEVIALCQKIVPGFNAGFCLPLSTLHKYFPVHLYASVSMRNLVVPTMLFLLSVFALAVFVKSVKFGRILIFGVLLFGSLYFATKYLYFSERRFVFPESPIISRLQGLAGVYRSWEYGNAYIDKNIPQILRLYSPDGYNGLFPREYGELMSTIMHDGSIGKSIARSDAGLKEASEKEAFGSNPYRLKLMSLLGVKYILESKLGDDKEHKTTTDRFPSDIFTKEYEDTTWRIWRYKSAYPRAFLAENYKIITDKQTIISAIFSSETDLRNTIVLEKHPVFPELTTPYTPSASQSSVTIDDYSPEFVRMSVTATRSAMLFLSDNYYPGWNVTVNGVDYPVYRADYTFRAVPVPAGISTVVFTYSPTWLPYVVFISLIGVTGFIYLMWKGNRV